jgi:integrase
VALANHPRGLERPGKQVFRWHKGGRLYNLLMKAAGDAGINLPEREAFHVFRHTYGTWMRRYAGLDSKGLVSTGTWKSKQPASRYLMLSSGEDNKSLATSFWRSRRNRP